MQIIDMHCDTIFELLRAKEQGEEYALRQNARHIDLERMQKSSYLIQNFAMFVHLKAAGDPWEKVCKLMDLYEEELAKNKDLILPAYTYDDILKSANEGKMSAVLTVEEGGVCKGEQEKLQTLFDRGVRMMTLTWNFPNELGYPNINSTIRETPYGEGNQTDGLTPTGIAFVEKMEELGMIPDVSHLSDAGFYDVLRVTKKPFVASHSNARAICPCRRNLTDDMIRKLAERGGVTGLNFCADFLEQVPEGQKNPGTIAAVVRHAKHIVNIGGIEVLGLGSDFDGIDTHEELPGAHSMPLLWEALKQGGFTENQLDKIFSQNVLRLYKECLPRA